MNFETCELYQIQRKRDLYHLLHTNKSELNHILYEYKVCINDDARLLEKPSEELKKIQKRLLYKLYQLDFPQYIFSGIKGRSSFNNALFHINSKYMLKLDMSKFFPNTHRNNVYNFFKYKLQMSSDVASLCTDIVTVNYENPKVIVESKVNEFLKLKNIKNTNHLPSGTPTSQILSYLANIDMFNIIIKYVTSHNLVCSIYVDDITISSAYRDITKNEEMQLKNIIQKCGHKISKNKTIRYGKTEYKKVTGFVISPDNKLVIPNKIKSKIKDQSKFVRKKDSIELKEKNKLIGLTNFANLSIEGKYTGLVNKVKSMDIKI